MEHTSKEEEPRPEGILENVITALCFQSMPNSTRKVMKLTYLVDVYHYEMFGKRVTEVPFRHYDHGPFAEQIYRCLENLHQRRILCDDVVETQHGPAIIPKPAVEETMIELPESVMEAVERVLADWGRIWPQRVVEYCKTTLPFLNTPYNREIDFSRIDPIEEYAREHGLDPEDVATEEIVEREDFARTCVEADRSLREGGRLLSYDEVFEA